jgi:hypothetical protein
MNYSTSQKPFLLKQQALLPSGSENEELGVLQAR